MINDHVVKCHEGFYDKQRYPRRVEYGGVVKVTKAQYAQMRNSDPSIELIKIEVPESVLARLITSAKKEHDEEKKVDSLAGMKTAASNEIIEWEPAPHYKGMLNKDGGMDD